MANSATWLRAILRVLSILVGGAKQVHDGRVNFRNGFTASQVPDALGDNLLTIDTEVGAAVYEPDPNTVPKRNGSGAGKFTTTISNVFSFTTPKTIEFREPLRFADPGVYDVVTGWSLDTNNELIANAVGLEFPVELTLIPGMTLTSVACVYTPESGHGGLPAVQPKVTLYELAYGGPPVALGSITDTAPDLISYETERTLTLDLSPGFTPVASRRYFVQFTMESGANSIPGLVLHASKWTGKVSAVWA